VKLDEETKRAAGILLHPTSLPGPYGVGELGPEALEFLDFLEKSGQGIWQVLPLGPTDKTGSPYSAGSAFAGNPLLISTERLIEDNLLASDSVEWIPPGPVDYPAAVARKEKLLREAFERFEPGKAFREFRDEHEGWLGDWSLFAALKNEYGTVPWNLWDVGLATRESGALARARESLREEVSYHEFVQFRFFRDWEETRSAARSRGVEIMGDAPIFLAHDSADVWANQELFYLDDAGDPTVVAGVPPDYFSETGQHWGNPLYHWDRMSRDGYAWWTARMRMALSLFDTVRLDHFRGFEAYWEIPADEKTAKNGRWIKGPGKGLFDALRKSLGELPIIAEDLGDITPEVETLRDSLNLPGMKVLQFAFSDSDNAHLPHNFTGENWVAYTGTHDNDTTNGWWTAASTEERAFARCYLGKESIAAWDFIRLAYSSTARRAVVPMQDVLELDTEARMNTPGTASGNWSWRVEKEPLTLGLAERLRGLTETYGR